MKRNITIENNVQCFNIEKFIVFSNHHEKVQVIAIPNQMYDELDSSSFHTKEGARFTKMMHPNR